MNEDDTQIDVVYMPAPSLADALTSTGHELVDSARSLLGSYFGDAENNPEYLRAFVELISDTASLWEYSAQQEYDMDDRQYAIQKALTQKKDWRVL